MLGGFYFILSFVLNSLHNIWANYAKLVLFFCFIGLFIALCCKVNFSFLESFKETNPRTSNYLMAVGVAQYFNIVFGMLPSLIIYYDASYEQLPPYFLYASIVYMVILLGGLGYVTYINYFKKNKKSNKKNKSQNKKKKS